MRPSILQITRAVHIPTRACGPPRAAAAFAIGNCCCCCCCRNGLADRRRRRGFAVVMQAGENEAATATAAATTGVDDRTHGPTNRSTDLKGQVQLTPQDGGPISDRKPVHMGCGRPTKNVRSHNELQKYIAPPGARALARARVVLRQCGCRTPTVSWHLLC